MKYVDPTGNDFLFADYDKSTNTMKLTYYYLGSSNNLIGISTYSFTVTNEVRNELNGLRENPDAKTLPSSGSRNWYYPRKFPNGIWNIRKSEPKDGSDPYLGEVFIPTDAHQEVPVYGDVNNAMPTVIDGNIPASTGVQDDTAYGFHASSSSTTLGCGKCDTQENANKFAEWSDRALNSKNGGSVVYVHE